MVGDAGVKRNRRRKARLDSSLIFSTTLTQSQALLGQGSGHFIGQRGQLWGVHHVDASSGGDIAKATGRGISRNSG